MKRVALLSLLIFTITTTVFAQDTNNDEGYYALIDTVKNIKGK